MAKPVVSFPSLGSSSSPAVQLAKKGVSTGRGFTFRSLFFGTWAAAATAYFMWNPLGWVIALIAAIAVGLQVGVAWAILEDRLGPSGIVVAIRDLVVTIGIKTVPVFFIEIGWGAWILMSLGFFLATMQSFFFAFTVNTAAVCNDPLSPGELAHTFECQRAVDSSYGWACGTCFIALPVVLIMIILHYRVIQGIKYALASNPKDPGSYVGMIDPEDIRDAESKAFWLIVDSALVPFLSILLCTFLIIVFADSAMVKAFGGFPANPWMTLVLGLFVVPLWIWRTVSFALLIIRSL